MKYFVDEMIDVIIDVLKNPPTVPIDFRFKKSLI